MHGKLFLDIPIDILYYVGGIRRNHWKGKVKKVLKKIEISKMHSL